MGTAIRNVRDIEANDRQALEHVLGQQLKDNQQVVIQVVTPNAEPTQKPSDAAQLPPSKLPEWCNVYAGLSDEEVEQLEKIILERADLTRPSE